VSLGESAVRVHEIRAQRPRAFDATVSFAENPLEIPSFFVLPRYQSRRQICHNPGGGGGEITPIP